MVKPGRPSECCLPILRFKVYVRFSGQQQLHYSGIGVVGRYRQHHTQPLERATDVPIPTMCGQKESEVKGIGQLHLLEEFSYQNPPLGFRSLYSIFAMLSGSAKGLQACRFAPIAEILGEGDLNGERRGLCS